MNRQESTQIIILTAAVVLLVLGAFFLENSIMSMVGRLFMAVLAFLLSLLIIVITNID